MLQLILTFEKPGVFLPVLADRDRKMPLKILLVQQAAVLIDVIGRQRLSLVGLNELIFRHDPLVLDGHDHLAELIDHAELAATDDDGDRPFERSDIVIGKGNGKLVPAVDDPPASAEIDAELIAPERLDLVVLGHQHQLAVGIHQPQQAIALDHDKLVGKRVVLIVFSVGQQATLLEGVQIRLPAAAEADEIIGNEVVVLVSDGHDVAPASSGETPAILRFEKDQIGRGHAHFIVSRRQPLPAFEVDQTGIVVVIGAKKRLGQQLDAIEFGFADHLPLPVDDAPTAVAGKGQIVIAQYLDPLVAARQDLPPPQIDHFPTIVFQYRHQLRRQDFEVLISRLHDLLPALAEQSDPAIALHHGVAIGLEFADGIVDGILHDLPFRIHQPPLLVHLDREDLLGEEGLYKNPQEKSNERSSAHEPGIVKKIEVTNFGNWFPKLSGSHVEKTSDSRILFDQPVENIGGILQIE